ncbi:ATP phosphoribosyltransferase [Rhizobiaceae bacterium]|nr:ATP phosphoribosyltransferase [Rhizobiaceae bacterium]
MMRLALPSKGRMKADILERFEAAGISVETAADERAYRGTIPSMPDVEVAFISNSEIARDLGTGAIHAGVTGEDLVREAVADMAGVHLMNPLGLGRADVVVAVPEAWIDVTTMADLADVAANYRRAYGRRLRVATKYWRITQDTFRAHGIAAYRIVDSLGATEGAPAAGSADIIVDITSSGATLDANRLRVLSDGVVLKSEARLVASHRASWDDSTRAALRRIADAL